jgi:hypothetical protein
MGGSVGSNGERGAITMKFNSQRGAERFAHYLQMLISGVRGVW